MKMSEKICTNCGNKVDGNVNFCPKCKSQSFRNVNELAKPKATFVQNLLYKYQNIYYVLSKAKVGALITFIVFGTLAFQTPGTILISLIIAFLVYAMGYALRRALMDKNSRSQIYFKNNNLGLIQDLIHLFGYWQDRENGEYKISKTKLVSLIIFFIFACVGIAQVPGNPFAFFVFGFFFSAPAFAVGYAIHRFLTSRPVKKVAKKAEPLIEKTTGIKVEKPKTSSNTYNVHEFDKYRKKLSELSIMYEIKEKNARSLIEKRFTPPQLTYDRFIASVDNSTKMFNMHSDAVSNIIGLASQDSAKIDHEINNRLDILESLVKKMDELVNELVLSLNENEEEDNVSNVFEDMDSLIDSVKNY